MYNQPLTCIEMHLCSSGQRKGSNAGQLIGLDLTWLARRTTDSNLVNMTDPRLELTACKETLTLIGSGLLVLASTQCYVSGGTILGESQLTLLQVRLSRV